MPGLSLRYRHGGISEYEYREEKTVFYNFQAGSGSLCNLHVLRI